MTRQEFIEDVNSFGDLISFCQDESLDTCDDVYDSYYINDILLDCISQMRDWEDIKRLLLDIPCGCSYYREDGCGGYEDADYYFDDYKNDVIRYMDDAGAWDEEDTDEDLYEPTCYAGSKEESEEDIETHSFMAVLGRAS